MLMNQQLCTTHQTATLALENPRDQGGSMRPAEIAGISARSQLKLNSMEKMQEIGCWALKNI